MWWFYWKALNQECATRILPMAAAAASSCWHHCCILIACPTVWILCSFSEWYSLHLCVIDFGLQGSDSYQVSLSLSTASVWSVPESVTKTNPLSPQHSLLQFFSLAWHHWHPPAIYILHLLRRLLAIRHLYEHDHLELRGWNVLLPFFVVDKSLLLIYCQFLELLVVVVCILLLKMRSLKKQLEIDLETLLLHSIF